MTRRLIVAPHADDESMGCGGLLAKYPDECRVIVLSSSGPMRAIEFENAMKVLGVKDYDWAGFHDGSLSLVMKELVTLLDQDMNRYRPNVLYLPSPALHQDHVAAYEAGMRAARRSMHDTHWFPPQVLIYDVATYDVGLYTTDYQWNVFEKLDESQVEMKQEACEQYASQQADLPHPITSICEIAAAVGRPRCVEFAEQFALVREVR